MKMTIIQLYLWKYDLRMKCNKANFPQNMIISVNGGNASANNYHYWRQWWRWRWLSLQCWTWDVMSGMQGSTHGHLSQHPAHMYHRSIYVQCAPLYCEECGSVGLVISGIFWSQFLTGENLQLQTCINFRFSISCTSPINFLSGPLPGVMCCATLIINFPRSLRPVITVTAVHSQARQEPRLPAVPPCVTSWALHIAHSPQCTLHNLHLAQSPHSIHAPCEPSPTLSLSSLRTSLTLHIAPSTDHRALSSGLVRYLASISALFVP